MYFFKCFTDPCGAGKDFIDGNCRPCPLDHFKEGWGYGACLPCIVGMSTNGLTGATKCTSMY